MDSVNVLVDSSCLLGESPLWHPDERCLYWLDILAGKLFRYDPAKGESETCYEGDPIGGMTLQENGDLLLFMARGAVATWHEGKLTQIIKEIPDERETRFNDVIAAPDGSIFCGTMPTDSRPGRLYHLSCGGELTIVLEGIGISNGLGFTIDGLGLYYTDSAKGEIYQFDYGRSSGEISNQRVFVSSTEPADGIPDGLTVDRDGYVWSCRWDGGCIIRYTPEGVEDRRIELPARQVTSLVFAGTGLRQLFVTSAGGEDREANGVSAGALFRVESGVEGVPEQRSKIDV